MKSRRPPSWGPPSWPDTSIRPSLLPRQHLRDPQVVGEALFAARKKSPKIAFHKLADRVLGKK
jgi:hypothetical protein